MHTLNSLAHFGLIIALILAFGFGFIVGRISS